MTPFRTIAAAAALALATAAPSPAHHDGERFSLGPVTVSHPHTVEATETAHAIEVFMTLENGGDAPVRLTGAEVSFAAPGVFQAQVVGDDGTLVTRDVAAVEIAAGQTLTLQPGGVRIVFNDVQRAIEGGDHFHARLTFAELGDLEIDVEIEHAEDHDHDHEEDAAS